MPMWWPFYLALGLLILLACWRAQDARGQWVAGIWCLGIIAMQLPLSEPGRWVYAAALWTFAGLMCGLMTGAARNGLVMWALSLGYWWLLTGTDGVERIAAFAVTEILGVLAVLIGGWGGIRHVWGYGSGGGFGRRLLGSGGGLPLVPVQGRTTAHPHARRAFGRRAGRADN